MGFDFEKFDGEIEVSFPQVNGSDWSVIRKNNTGTYAEYSGDDGMTVSIVIEELDDPERRAMWDSSTDEEIVDLVYREIIDHMSCNGRE